MDLQDHKIGADKDSFWFKARGGLIEILLSNTSSSNKDIKILDLGAGTGDLAPLLNKFGLVYAIDPEAESLELIPKDSVHEKTVGDATNLPYPDNFFDTVVAFDVLEHVEHDTKAVQEISRVLKKCGAFVFTVPAGPALFGAHDRALKHWRRYRKSEVKKLLSDFSIRKFGSWRFFLFIPTAFQRLLDRSSEPKARFLVWPKPIDTLFYLILRLENFLIKSNIKLPFGLTIFGVCQKK